jgi:hypothetical protein
VLPSGALSLDVIPETGNVLPTDGHRIGIQLVAALILRLPEVPYAIADAVGHGSLFYEGGRKAKYERYTGFKTWPKMGFDTQEDFAFSSYLKVLKGRVTPARRPSTFYLDTQRLNDLGTEGKRWSVLKATETREGELLWARYGMPLTLRFDNTPGSRSMKRFLSLFRRFPTEEERRMKRMEPKQETDGTT